MRIPLYIRDLILEGKNVAVAGFGTFECNKINAGYDKENSRFVPPGREVKFRYDENTRGSEFTFYVTEKESIKIEEAQQLIEDAVDEINYQLDRGKRIKYTGLGAFKLDPENKIVFEPDNELLTGGEFFGLHAVPVAATAGSKRSIAMKLFLIVLLVLGVGLVSYWGYVVWKMVGNQKQTQTAPILLAPPQPANVVVTSPGQKSLDSIREQITPSKPASVNTVTTNITEEKEAEPVKTVAKKPEPKKVEAAKPDESEAVTGSRYYIVAGAFRSEDGARKFVGQLKAKGYKSELFAKTENGLNMVSYVSFKTRAEADAELRRIRNDENKTAYIVNR